MLASCLVSISLLAAAPAFSDEMGNVEATAAAPFPTISFKNEKDETRELKKELGAKLTIVHFWATWCVPCIAELPAVDRMQKDYATKGLKVISISEDGTGKMKAVQGFYKQHGIQNLPTYLDISQGAFVESKARGVPTSFILNAKGEQIAIVEGPVQWQSKRVTDFLDEQVK